MKNVDENRLIITPLGAGQEVGRSCIVMTYKGKNVMVNHKLISFQNIAKIIIVRLRGSHEIHRARVFALFR